MTGIDVRFVDRGSARIWSCTSGRGLPLLLFNGGPGCDDYLEPVAETLTDLCQVIRFEPRGCGRSDWDGRYDLDTLLQDAEAVCAAWDVQTCIAGGHSFGACAALAFALRAPRRVLGLLGIAGGSLVKDRAWSEAYHRGLREQGEDLGGAEFSADDRANSEGNRAWRDFLRRPALLREVAELQVPAVFINGSADIRPNWPTQQLAALLPRGRYVEIPGAAHFIWLTHREELRRELRRAVSCFQSRSSARLLADSSLKNVSEV